MQGRVVGVIKGIWETLKKELKGPKIQEKSFSIEYGKIIDRKVNNDIKVTGKNIVGNIEIFDLKEETMPKIYDLALKKSCNSIKFFQEDIFAQVEKLELSGFKLKISSKKIEKIRKGFIAGAKVKIEPLIKSIKSGSEKTDIKNGIGKVMELPRKIKGVRGDDFYKKDYDLLMKRVAEWGKKNKIYDMSLFEIEYVFKAIPVERVKNIKYYSENGSVELFFNSEKDTGKSMDFIILSNKNNQKREKIFI